MISLLAWPWGSTVWRRPGSCPVPPAGTGRSHGHTAAHPTAPGWAAALRVLLGRV